MTTNCNDFDRKLMDGIIQASLDVSRFKQFCAILKKTTDYEPFVNSVMTQLAIYLCADDIKKDVELKDLVPLLEKNKVLTSGEAQNLLITTADGEMLLNYLQLKDASIYMTFLRCFKMDNQSDLVRIIEEKLSSLHLNDNDKGRHKKIPFQLTTRDSGIFTPSPVTSLQATDIADGLSKLAIVKEESCRDLDLGYAYDAITDELDSLDEQYKDECERLERYYEDMQLILANKKNDAQRLLKQLHWEQKKDLEATRNEVRKQIRHRERGQKLPGKINWSVPQSKPDAYVKVMTDVTNSDQLKQWDISVIVGSAHHRTTIAQGLGLKWAYANKVASFTVEFRDIQNHSLIARSENDMMDLTSNFDCTIIDSEGSIVKHTHKIVPSSSMWVEGMGRVTYIPTVTGYFDVSLKCNGRPITGSPFKVLVFPLSEYYKLLTEPQEVLSIRETITGLTFTSSGDAAICTEDGKLYIVKHADCAYDFVDVTAYHSGLSLNFPCGISCDSSDNLVVANTKNSQIVKASTPAAKEKMFISSELKFEPLCVAAHDRMVAAGGTRDVVICNHDLDILHTVTFSSSLSALTIASNLSIHIAVSETIDDKHYNYACIENIDSKAYKKRFAYLSPTNTKPSEHTMNDIVIDKEHNIIVCYLNHPTVAMFNSNGELLSCYENWGSKWYGEFAAVAESHNTGLLLVDQTRNKLLESRFDESLATYMPSIEETDYYY